MNTFAFNLEVFVKKKEPTEIIKTFLAEKKRINTTFMFVLSSNIMSLSLAVVIQFE